jgi:hypothetical protein
MKLLSTRRSIVAAAVALAAFGAHAVPVTLTKLTGLAGSAPAAATAVYKADLSTLSGSFAAISIGDNSAGLGGSPGQFSGFDLDAIKLSTTNCADAACASAAVGLSVFNFASGVFFTPGAQRAPADPKLFGTGPGGTSLDNAVARLALFDGVSATDATATGFISLGDNGTIAFNLSALTSPMGLFLSIGEVGDNGEVAASNIQVLQEPLPEPETYALLLGGLGLLGWVGRRRRQRQR